MRSPSSRDTGLLAVVASNLVAPVGVLALGWSTTVLLGVFVLELAAVLWWSVVKVPFAAKRPNNAVDETRLLGLLQVKRGSIALPGPFPPVYPRNLPSLFVVGFVLAPLELLVAFAAFAIPDPTITNAAVGQLFLGGVAVFAGRGVETVADYFVGGGYRDHSPRSVMLQSFQHLFGVGALLFVVGPLEGALASGGVLALVLAGKLVYDLRSLQVARDDESRGLFYRLYGSEETEIAPEPVTVPDEAPTYTARPRRAVAVADALFRGVTYTVSSGAAFGWVVAAGLYAFAPASGLWLVPLAGVLAALLLRAVVRYLRYGTLEYRCHDGLLVVHDRLLDEPQARLDRTEVADLTVARDPVDRLCGTRTVHLDAEESAESELYWTVPDPEDIEGDDPNRTAPVTLRHVADPATIADALGVRWLYDRDAASGD